MFDYCQDVIATYRESSIHQASVGFVHSVLRIADLQGVGNEDYDYTELTGLTREGEVTEAAKRTKEIARTLKHVLEGHLLDEASLPRDHLLVVLQPL